MGRPQACRIYLFPPRTEVHQPKLGTKHCLNERDAKVYLGCKLTAMEPNEPYTGDNVHMLQALCDFCILQNTWSSMKEAYFILTIHTFPAVGCRNRCSHDSAWNLKGVRRNHKSTFFLAPWKGLGVKDTRNAHVWVIKEGQWPWLTALVNHKSNLLPL